MNDKRCPHSTRVFSNPLVHHSLVTWIVATVFLFGLTSRSSFGQDQAPDYSSELPRLAPLDPHDALRSFHVAEGFRIELAACEPIVVDPVALAFDADGRLFVVEMRGYSEDADLNLGRIRLLEDRDGDGRYDQSTVFAEGLSWPTAITCYDGGIFVAAAPDLIYLRDTNDDGRADQRRVIFRGFGRDNVQGLVNTLTWGLDNRIHGATSSSGAALALVESADAPLVSLRGRDFAWDPRTFAVGATSGGGQHGMSFDRWGDKFVCSNSDHLQQIMYEDRYLEQNQFATPRPARVSIAADGPQADVFRTSPVEPWRIVRTRLRVQGQVPGPIEGGGRAAGYFTGATGILRYRGDQFDNRYLDYAFVCDVGSNLIHRKQLTDTGIQYRGERVDEASEFVTSDDIWFRPVQLANAPDGSIFVLDMYREVIEHPLSLPPVIKRHLDLTSGRNRGRLYRIVPTNFRYRPPERYSEFSSAELARLLEHANGWHRETASRLLYERQDRSVVPDLRQLLEHGRSAEARLHAMYALDGLDSLQVDDLTRGLRDSAAQVRRHAIRLAERRTDSHAPLADLLLQMIDDPSLDVRYQLAFSLAYVPPSDARLKALAALAEDAALAQGVGDRDAGNSLYQRMAVELAAGESAAALLQMLVGNRNVANSPDGQELLQSLAAQVRRRADVADVAAMAALLRSELQTTGGVTSASWCFELLRAGHPEWTDQLWASEAGRFVRSRLETLPNLALDNALPIARRVAAINWLPYLAWDSAEPAFRELLNASQPAEVHQAVFQALRSQSNAKVPALMWDRWSELSPRLRSEAVDLLLERRDWQAGLFQALSEKRLGRLDLSASQQQRLVQAVGAERWNAWLSAAGSLDSTSPSSWQSYAAKLTDAADTAAGRQIFRRACASCHQLDGEGHAIGPNLAAMQNRGPEAILANVLEPNREVNPQYLAYTLVTQDGRILSGMIRGETATSIELVSADNKAVTVLRSEIETLRSTGQSLMPTGLEQQITPAEMNDLIGYLMSIPSP